MIKGFALTLLFLCAIIWARPSVYIAPAKLNGVHEDYGRSIVQWTKESVENGGKASIVDSISQSEYTLQISLVRDSSYYGVIATFKILDTKSNTVEWSYSSLAYRPQDFSYAIGEFCQRFGKWNGLKLGVGAGALGLFLPDFQAAPALDLSVHYMFNNEFVTLDANAALSPSLFYYGGFLSLAHVFNFKKLFPYVGMGGGYSIMEFDGDDHTINNGSVELLGKAGAIFKPRESSKFYVLEVRYTHDIFNDLYIEGHNGKDVSNRNVVKPHGLLATIQVWW